MKKLLVGLVAASLLAAAAPAVAAKLSHETSTAINCAVLSRLNKLDDLADEYIAAIPSDTSQKSLAYQIGVINGKLQMYATLEDHDMPTAAKHLYAIICTFEQLSRGEK